MTPRFTYRYSRWHSDLSLWFVADFVIQNLAVGMVAAFALAAAGKGTGPVFAPWAAGPSTSEADTQTARGHRVPSEAVKSLAAGSRASTALLEAACFGMHHTLPDLAALVLVAAERLGGRGRAPDEKVDHLAQLS